MSSIWQMLVRDSETTVSTDQLDSNPVLLGTPQGTVDLTTGILRPFAPLRPHYYDNSRTRHRIMIAAAHSLAGETELAKGALKRAKNLELNPNRFISELPLSDDFSSKLEEGLMALR